MAKNVQTPRQERNSIGSFLKKLTFDHRISIGGSLFSTLFAAFIALLVVYVQKHQQDERELAQQVQTEQNKLKYLHFIINDSYRTLESYNSLADRMKISFNQNPFVIPDFATYSSHSLSELSNKINQQEYYLASINQIQDEGIAEIFQMYNSLYDNFNNSLTHYRKEYPELVKEKDLYDESLEALAEALGMHSNISQTIVLGDKRRAITEINRLLGVYKNDLSQLDRNSRLRDAEPKFLSPAAQLVNQYGEGAYPKITLRYKEALKAYNAYIIRIYNVVKSFEGNQAEQQRVLARIKEVGKPLDDYVQRLKKKQ